MLHEFIVKYPVECLIIALLSISLTLIIEYGIRREIREYKENKEIMNKYETVNRHRHRKDVR